MESLLLIVQIVLAVLIIGVVLLQRSDADGFGMGSGSGVGLMSGRAKASFMTRFTSVLAALFMLNSLAYSVVVSRSSAVNDIEDIAKQVKAEKELAEPTKAPLADAVPAVKDAPKAAAPVEAPKAETPAEPAKEAPKAAEPAKDTPKAEAPKADAAKAEPKADKK